MRWHGDLLKLQSQEVPFRLASALRCGRTREGGAGRGGGEGAQVGRPSDIWSLGCILYQMVYGRTPFAHLPGLIQKMHAITNPTHAISFPPLHNAALGEAMRRSLDRDPKTRITMRVPRPPPPPTPGTCTLRTARTRVATAVLPPAPSPPGSLLQRSGAAQSLLHLGTALPAAQTVGTPWQELLLHPFLRPTAAHPALTEEQVKQLLAQVPPVDALLLIPLQI